MIYCRLHNKIYDESELIGCGKCKDSIKLLDMYYGHNYGKCI